MSTTSIDGHKRENFLFFSSLTLTVLRISFGDVFFLIVAITTLAPLCFFFIPPPWPSYQRRANFFSEIIKKESQNRTRARLFVPSTSVPRRCPHKSLTLNYFFFIALVCSLPPHPKMSSTNFIASFRSSHFHVCEKPHTCSTAFFLSKRKQKNKKRCFMHTMTLKILFFFLSCIRNFPFSVSFLFFMNLHFLFFFALSKLSCTNNGKENDTIVKKASFKLSQGYGKLMAISRKKQHHKHSYLVFCTKAPVNFICNLHNSWALMGLAICSLTFYVPTPKVFFFNFSSSLRSYREKSISSAHVVSLFFFRIESSDPGQPTRMPLNFKRTIKVFCFVCALIAISSWIVIREPLW